MALIILNHSEFSAVGALQPISGPVQCPAGNATTTNCQRLLCLCVELSFVDGSFPQVQSGVSENGWDGHRNYDCIIRWNWGALSSVKPNSTGDNEWKSRSIGFCVMLFSGKPCYWLPKKTPAAEALCKPIEIGWPWSYYPKNIEFRHKKNTTIDHIFIYICSKEIQYHIWYNDYNSWIFEFIFKF